MDFRKLWFHWGGFSQIVISLRWIFETFNFSEASFRKLESFRKYFAGDFRKFRKISKISPASSENFGKFRKSRRRFPKISENFENLAGPNIFWQIPRFSPPKYFPKFWEKLNFLKEKWPRKKNFSPAGPFQMRGVPLRPLATPGAGPRRAKISAEFFLEFFFRFSKKGTAVETPGVGGRVLGASGA